MAASRSLDAIAINPANLALPDDGTVTVSLMPVGVGVGGEDHFNFALGFGLKLWVVQLDVAADNIGWLFSHDSFSRGSLGVGLTLKM